VWLWVWEWMFRWKGTKFSGELFWILLHGVNKLVTRNQIVERIGIVVTLWNPIRELRVSNLDRITTYSKVFFKFASRMLVDYLQIHLWLMVWGTRFETQMGQRLYWDISWSSSVHPHECGIVPWKRARRLPSAFFPNHNSLLILPFGITWPQVLTVSLNKSQINQSIPTVFFRILVYPPIMLMFHLTLVQRVVFLAIK
jgi:hypothetical protein